jgi:hypothetical protein
MFKGKSVLANDWLEFHIDRKTGPGPAAGPVNVFTPGGQPLATFFDRDRFFIGDVVYYAAKGVKR